jgi:integrase
MTLSVVGERTIRRSTQIPHDAPGAGQRAEQKQQAIALFNKLQAEMVLRKHDVGPKAAVTLHKYLDWYEEHVSAQKRSAAAYEATVFRRLRLDFDKHALLTELTLNRIIEWRSQRLKTVRGNASKGATDTVKPNTVNRQVDVISHVLASAVPRYLPENPIAGLKPLKAEAIEAITLSRADEAKLLAVLEPADQAIIVAALDSLVRAGDLVELRWAQDHGKYLTILNPKGGTSYKTPVSSRLRTLLDALPKTSAYIFEHRRQAKTEALRVNSLKQMLEYACTRAGVPYGRGTGITFHGLRHTGATRMIDAGVNVRLVQSVGGWKSLRMLTRYLHPTDEAAAAAVEAIGRGVDFTPVSRTRKTA